MVDVVRSEIVVHTNPRSDGYANITTVTGGRLALPGCDRTVAFEEILPLD